MESKPDLCFHELHQDPANGFQPTAAGSTADRLGLIAALVMKFSSSQDFQEKDRSNEE